MFTHSLPITGVLSLFLNQLKKRRIKLTSNMQGITGIRDLTKRQCGIRQTLNEYGFDCYPQSGIRQKLGTDTGFEGKMTFMVVSVKKFCYLAKTI